MDQKRKISNKNVKTKINWFRIKDACVSGCFVLNKQYNKMLGFRFSGCSVRKSKGDSSQGFKVKKITCETLENKCQLDQGHTAGKGHNWDQI